jgi:hypothetical protein
LFAVGAALAPLEEELLELLDDDLVIKAEVSRGREKRRDKKRDEQRDMKYLRGVHLGVSLGRSRLLLLAKERHGVSKGLISTLCSIFSSLTSLAGSALSAASALVAFLAARSRLRTLVASPMMMMVIIMMMVVAHFCRVTCKIFPA